MTYSAISLPFIFFMSLGLEAESGCIEGRVLETSGAPLPSLFVTASGLDGKFSIQVGTDSDGSFLINGWVVAGEGYDLMAKESSGERGVDSSGITEGAAIRAIAAEEDR